MMAKSTRCHAAVVNGMVKTNVIVSYSDSNDFCTNYNIAPFAGEVHSTDDFNGAVVVMPVGAELDMEKYIIDYANFSSVLKEIAAHVPHVEAGELVKLCFIEL